MLRPSTQADPVQEGSTSNLGPVLIQQRTIVYDQYHSRTNMTRSSLTSSLRKGWQITPTTGIFLCVRPIEQPTYGL
jgi:hypothetical protein